LEDADRRAINPYATMEGYVVRDVSGEGVGEVEGTVYDAASDVLKYLVVAGRTVLADRIDVDPAAGQVSLPYAAETVRSAPEMEEISGAFDRAVREHYGEA
jgi:hypothetical protein